MIDADSKEYRDTEGALYEVALILSQQHALQRRRRSMTAMVVVVFVLCAVAGLTGLVAVVLHG